MPNRTLTVASRRSPLALRQTEMVVAHLSRALPECRFEVKKIVTTGDRQRDWSLEKEGGKGLFTGEIEEALRRGEADLGMHSTKDLPTEFSSDLALAGFLPRDDPRDVLVVREGVKEPRVLATNSPRRRAQAGLMFPDAEWKDIRGNVETRLQKIIEGHADGTVLALAGLNRLGISEAPGLILEPLAIDKMVPAVGQGAIAVQCRRDEVEMYSEFLDKATKWAVEIERKFLGLLGGGCHAAFAGHYVDGILHVYHERCGYRQYPLPESPEEIDAAVDAVVRELEGR